VFVAIPLHNNYCKVWYKKELREFYKFYLKQLWKNK
jgi:hypothetical protein